MYQNQDFLNADGGNQNTQKLDISSIIAPTLLLAVVGLTFVMVARALPKN
jgi:hypothetical protein